MKKFKLFFIALIIVGSSARLFAFGVGGYFVMGGNAATRYQPGPHDDYSSFVVGCGATIELNLMKDHFLTYRANIGYEGLINDQLTYELLNRIGILNSFGFTIYKNETVRLYAGPQIAFRYQFTGKTYRDTFSGWYYNIRYGLNAFSLGLGGMFGVDVKVAENIIIVPEVGLRYEYYTGKLKRTGYISTSLGDLKTVRTIDTEAHAFEGTVSFTVLYRMNLGSFSL
jgi:hypothetical protein